MIACSHTCPALPQAGVTEAPTVALLERRQRRMLWLGSGLIAAVSIGWGGYFAFQGLWGAVPLDVLALLSAVATAELTRRGRLRAASRLMLAVMVVLLTASAAVLDLPTPEVPRSAHQFLLALAVMSCLLTRDEPAWVRHGVPVLCFGIYLVFASVNGGPVTPLALPEPLRAQGVWVNNGIALLAILGTLQVLQADAAARSGLVAELRDALVQGEFQLHVQAQVDASGRVHGAEALLRWQHPQRGAVSPAEFIPVAERSGLMRPIGDWVLRSACLQLVAWRHQPVTADLVLAVNVSATQFEQADFVPRVLAILAQTGADPRRLKLELTESVLAHDLDDIVAKMQALKAHGIGFALDDFGTGFSSLSYLGRLPLDQLKIDRSFVQAMCDTGHDQAIVQAVVTLGQTLGLEVIAEGVETDAQRRLLSGIGCRLYQGYLFCRPQPVADFERWLASRPQEVPRSTPAPVAASGAGAARLDAPVPVG